MEVETEVFNSEK